MKRSQYLRQSWTPILSLPALLSSVFIHIKKIIGQAMSRTQNLAPRIHWDSLILKLWQASGIKSEDYKLHGKSTALGRSKQSELRHQHIR